MKNTVKLYMTNTEKKKKGEQPLYLEPFSCPTDRTRKLRLYCKNQPITALADIWWVLSSLFTVKDSHSADGTDVTSLPVQQMVVIGVVVVIVVAGGEPQCGLTSCSLALVGWAQVTRERESDTLSSPFPLCYSTEDDPTGNDITQLNRAEERKGGMGKKD